MRIIDQKVEVLYPRSIAEGIESLKRIETAGRNCWRSEGKITEDSYRPFIANLMKRGHESPLEFATVMLDITTSRDVLAEITRHRLASFAVESQRYVDESKTGDIAFIRPLCFRNIPEKPTLGFVDNSEAAYYTWLETMENIESAYKRMRDLGIRNEDARKVLPNSTACRIMMSVNLRELLHIYSLRSSPAAYPEMRELMRLLKIEIDKVYPGLFPEKDENK